MNDRPFNVLFLCTGNSARSILAESLVNHWGRGKFIGYSAGSAPKGQVHPIALELLRQMKLPASDMRSKSWDEFAQPGAPQLDFVFTVCDNAAGEMCPVWPGQPMTAHWGVEDPAAVEGSETAKWLAFRNAFANWKIASRYSPACRSGLSIGPDCSNASWRSASREPPTKWHR